MDDNSTGLSLRELVLEIREDVKRLNDKINQIDRTGSIGTREELNDHETRIRSLERSKWAFGGVGSAVGAAAGVLAGMFGH